MVLISIKIVIFLYLYHALKLIMIVMLLTLFIVSRMVKYIGYGNAAGMLAKKGLLGRSQTETHSSESEDSETEEYLKYKEQ